MSAFKSGGNLRFWRIALLLLGLLASNAVQLAAQTHWHALGAPAAVATSGFSQQSPDTGSPERDGCLLCQIAAHAGSAAPPAGLELLLSPQQLFHVSLRSAGYVAAVVRPAYAWQSRGPPQV
jgi:hypothetical protein